jgi:hypothetical protein
MQGYRTIIINVLTFLVALFGWDGLIKFVDPQYIVMGATAVNTALRYVTTTAVGQAPVQPAPQLPGAVPIVLLLALAAGLSGCAAHKTPVVADVVSAAPFWCTLATGPAIDTAAGAIMAQVPKGTDQATAQRYVDLALQIKNMAAPAACMLLKSYEAQQPVQ